MLFKFIKFLYILFQVRTCLYGMFPTMAGDARLGGELTSLELK